MTFHVYFLTDATGSMSEYLKSLNSTLSQVISMCELLFGETMRLHLIAYRDYCDPQVILTQVDKTTDELRQFAQELEADGGGDAPEAMKTGLNTVLELIQAIHQSQGNAIVLHYTDAEPHLSYNGSQNFWAEKKALAHGIVDWIEICRKFQEFHVPGMFGHSFD